MSTDLSPQNEQFIQDAVARGRFPGRREALDAAVELLRHREELVRQVNAGIKEIDRGETMPLDIEKIMAQIHRRLEVDSSATPSTQGAVSPSVSPLSDEEFEAALDELDALASEYELPSLPDEAITREAIYGDHP